VEPAWPSMISKSDLHSQDFSNANNAEIK